MSVAPVTGQLRVSWITWLPLILVSAAFFLLWPTSQSLIYEWEDRAQTTMYTHGYLVAVICLWLLFRNRGQVLRMPLRPNAFALVALIATAVLWLVAVRGGVQTVHQVLMPVLMWLAVCSALGMRAALANSFAIAYLYFAIPVWGHLNEILQHATVVVVELMLRLSGVTAYVDGNFVHMAAGTVEIAAGCSGLHYFIVAFAIGALYGEIHHDDLRLRCKQIGLVLALALVTNWLRVYIIIVAGYLTDMQHYLVTVSHYAFGWWVFAVAMVVYFLVVRRMQPDGGMADSGVYEPGQSLPRASLVTGLVLSIAGLAAAPAWNALLSVAEAEEAVDNLLPRQVDGWTGPSAPAPAHWTPVYEGADRIARGDYLQDTQRVEVFVAAYASQAQGKELVGYKNSLLGASDGAVVSGAVASTTRPMRELVVRDRREGRWLIWYAYRIDSWQTASNLAAQSYYGVASLVGSPESRVLAVRTACVEKSCADARKRLQGFIAGANFGRLEGES